MSSIRAFKPGDKFVNDAGELEFIQYLGKNKKNKLICQWKCFCGKLFTVISCGSIKNQTTKSCGCWNQKVLENKVKDPETMYLYRLWAHIKSKCYNVNDASYCSYGGRGIIIQDSWKNDSDKFILDITAEIGNRPSDRCQLDRINNDGNYESLNLRWATSKQNCRNRRSNIFLTIFGETKVLAEWAEQSGVSGNTIQNRIKRGVPENKLLEMPKNKNKNNINYLRSIYNNIINRCYSVGCCDYKNYGGRGITICSEWKDDFKKFKIDIVNNIGNRPTDLHQLNRINNDGNYEIKNLNWLLSKDNNRNRRNNKLITINGETKTEMEWSEISGLRRGTISQRLTNGWDHDELLQPLIKKKADEETVEKVRLEFSLGSTITSLTKKYNIRHAVLADIIRKRGAYESK